MQKYHWQNGNVKKLTPLLDHNTHSNLLNNWRRSSIKGTEKHEIVELDKSKRHGEHGINNVQLSPNAI